MKSRTQHYAQAHSDLILPPDDDKADNTKPEGVTADPNLFRCPICDTYFSQRNSLKRHYARTHPGQEPPNAFRLLNIIN